MSSGLSTLIPDPVPVVLAPMSGVTDAPFRRLARRYGASLTVTEMVASDRLVTGEDEAFERAACDEIGGVYAIQLAGCRPDWMAEAARIAEGQGAALIDINMGCPARRVVGGYAGSSLMRDLDVAESLVAAAVGAVSVPVSVKMRLGWDWRTLNAPELSQRAERLGAAFVSVHGRTRCDFYKGEADWTAIARTTRAVTIPVLANGDIGSVAAARQALSLSGCHGVLVGRAAVGRPWLLGEIAAALNGRDWTAPGPDERLDAAREQLAGSLACYGSKRGLLTFRKHLAAYLTQEGVSRDAVAALCRIEQPHDLDAALRAVWPQPALEAA